MTVKEWLSNISYDPHSQMILHFGDDFKHIADLPVLDIRGWGKISQSFKTTEEAMKFQDGVGQFIVQAIKEKLENDTKSSTFKN